MSSRAPKQWVLTKTETVNSFENWKQNLSYILSLDTNFAPFLDPSMKWTKKTRNDTSRGLTDDSDAITSNRRTATQKVAHLEMMLGQIANYCPVLSRNTIIKSSTSISSIWQMIRAHYGFQSTGSHFLDLAEFKLETEERPEDLFQRLTAFFEDNLLTADCGLTHHGDDPTEEDMSPALENTIVLLWLQLVHKELPRLVKQRYGTELRSRTLASIKPEISQALSSLLDEIHSADEGRVMRMSGRSNNSYQRLPPTVRHPHRQDRSRDHRHRQKPTCPICKEARYPRTDHFLSSCPYLSDADKRYMARTRNIQAMEEVYDENEEYNDSDLFELNNLYESELTLNTTTPTSTSYPVSNARPTPPVVPLVSRVQIKQSPVINTFYRHSPLAITLDTGAETNLVKESIAHQLGLKITPSTQYATQADGSSQLMIIGETKFNIQRNGQEFFLEALVARNIDADVLAGIPFMAFNDITIRPARKEITFSDGSVCQYNGNNGVSTNNTVRRTRVVPIRAPPIHTTLWPGEFIEIDDPLASLNTDCILAVEPRFDTPQSIKRGETIWPSPAITQSISGKIRIPNDTELPIIIRKNEHIAQVAPVFSPSHTESHSDFRADTMHTS